ncbi:hypothetical protein EIM50_08820 [Pseudoxanthomonas sp. SGD-10]|jgi:hypothetical protein|uniref:hypothetical protein n=1 Tax=unclassified Pseudoxanthomonas TaxID=2645906 RepID=UPI0002E43938|nr:MULTISPECIES: hypothetical protein [unclassified Pseudoxanthomonas]RRN79362.1 hypothetical protein EIM50_08820 [Pseudoxanthomonas sp. SGD-10]
MGILRTAAVAALGVVAYRAWQRHKSDGGSSHAVADDAGTTPPHGDPRREDIDGGDEARASSDVVGLGGTPDTAATFDGEESEPPRAAQASPGFGG